MKFSTLLLSIFLIGSIPGTIPAMKLNKASTPTNYSKPILKILTGSALLTAFALMPHERMFTYPPGSSSRIFFAITATALFGSGYVSIGSGLDDLIGEPSPIICEGDFYYEITSGAANVYYGSLAYEITSGSQNVLHGS